MFLLRYLKPANGLPDPRGSLSTVSSPEVISEINEDIEEATCCAAEKKSIQDVQLIQVFTNRQICFSTWSNRLGRSTILWSNGLVLSALACQSLGPGLMIQTKVSFFLS